MVVRHVEDSVTFKDKGDYTFVPGKHFDIPQQDAAYSANWDEIDWTVVNSNVTRGTDYHPNNTGLVPTYLDHTLNVYVSEHVDTMNVVFEDVVINYLCTIKMVFDLPGIYVGDVVTYSFFVQIFRPGTGEVGSEVTETKVIFDGSSSLSNTITHLGKVLQRWTGGIGIQASGMVIGVIQGLPLTLNMRITSEVTARDGVPFDGAKPYKILSIRAEAVARAYTFNWEPYALGGSPMLQY